MSGLSPDQIDQLQSELASRGKISAVQLYRSWTKCSLLEAKNVVESLESDGELNETTDQSSGEIRDDEMRQVDQAIARGNKLEAVKLYKQFTGQRLKESKKFVEARMNDPARSSDQTSNPSAMQTQRSGCFSSLLIFVTLTVGLAAAMS